MYRYTPPKFKKQQDNNRRDKALINMQDSIAYFKKEYPDGFNDKKWIFKPFFDDCPLKVIQKEKEFNKDYTFGHAGPTTGVFGSYTRVVYIVDTNKIIFNTDNDNLDDLLECENDGSHDSLPANKYPFISVCTSDLIYEFC